MDSSQIEGLPDRSVEEEAGEVSTPDLTAEEEEAFVEDLGRAWILSPRQERGAQLKALGRSDAEIAEELGMNRATPWRWRSDVGFRLRVSQLQAEAADAAADAFGETVRLAMNVVKREVEGGNLQAAIHVLRLIGPELARAYAQRRPRDLDEMLMVLGREEDHHALVASAIKDDRKHLLVRQLNELASTEAPEEIRDRMLANAAAPILELGRSPDPLPAEFHMEHAHEVLGQLSDRISMLLRAMGLVGTEGEERFEADFVLAWKELGEAYELLFDGEEERVLVRPTAITAIGHLARVLLVVLGGLDGIVGASHRDHLTNAERLATALQGINDRGGRSGGQLVSLLRNLDVAIAEVAWALGAGGGVG